MVSHRYVAEAFVLPRFLKERGITAVLDAVERNEPDFFIPVWFEAGFRFSPMLHHRVVGALRLGVISFPMPKEPGEAYLAVVVGSPRDATVARYFTWELGLRLGFDDQETGTVIGEWGERGHSNFGPGPAFTPDFASAMESVILRVIDIVGAAN